MRSNGDYTCEPSYTAQAAALPDGSSLEGLKVLDLSRVLAGPFAGRMLCDLGADVVKVEPPDGDLTRLWGAVLGGVPGYFHQQNAGKRDICVDLMKPPGVELVKRLAAQADLVIENFRPGVLARLGLGYEVLKSLREDIVLLSISGFGQQGPESRRPAYAAAIHAEAGLVRRQAREGRPPSDIPDVGGRHQRLAARLGGGVVGAADARSYRRRAAHRHRDAGHHAGHRRPAAIRLGGFPRYRAGVVRNLADRRRARC